MNPPALGSPKPQAQRRRPSRSDSSTPGAPQGNINALKHGLYSSSLKKWKRSELKALMSNGLQDQIIMMRALTKQLMDLSQGVTTIEEAASILGTFGMASIRLARMLEVQKNLGGEETDVVLQAISAALAQVQEEMKIDE